MKLTCYTIEEPPHELIPGGPERDWMEEFADRHPYRCLPLVIANTTGWEIRSPCSFTASWTGGPGVDDIRIDPDDDYPNLGRLVTSHFSRGVLTFHTGYLFRTEPDWDLWVGGAPNHVKDGIQPLTGVVETDWLPFPFTMNWKFTRPGMISFKKGEPFCFVMPIPHRTYDSVQPITKKLVDDKDLFAQYQAWAESRTGFIDRLQARDADTLKQGWQRHYFKGEPVAGAPRDPSETHINRRRLKAPRPAGEGE